MAIDIRRAVRMRCIVEMIWNGRAKVKLDNFNSSRMSAKAKAQIP
jgi:hypothetical protein